MFVFLLPWSLKRRALNSWFGYQIHPTARIGFAWIFPKKLIMKENSQISHLTVAIHLDMIEMNENAIIGHSNWITGFPTGTPSKHFIHQTDRQSALFMGEHSSITKHHHVDCTSPITIGRFSTIAGYYSQILTHSVNVFENRQESNPIVIGDYTFVGTNSVILGGSILPAYCVLGAKSLLNKPFVEEWKLYAGSPASLIQPIPKDAKYFLRTDGYVI